MTKVKLLKPHTHAEQDYQPGAVIEVEPGQAEWLIALGVAKPASPTPTLPRKTGEGASNVKGE